MISSASCSDPYIQSLGEEILKSFPLNPAAKEMDQCKKSKNIEVKIEAEHIALLNANLRKLADSSKGRKKYRNKRDAEC